MILSLVVMGLLNACATPETRAPQNRQPETAATTTSTKPATQKGTVYRAVVAKIADGDTITVHDEQGKAHKIRLAYIDAPEIKQNHGKDSQAALAELLQGETVEVNVQDIDRYKREVALITHRGQDVNYRQIRLGNAWHYTAYAKTQLSADFARYQAAMALAKSKGMGLWVYARPQAPWDYRKQQRSKTLDSE